jgi:hypothetical protein
MNKYHSEISPIMMIPSLTYLMKHVNIPVSPVEIIFLSWQYLPTNSQLSEGVKMNYKLLYGPTETEYYMIVYKNRYGAFAGMNNIIFYKDYDNIIEE